jgi:hypothetical protein
MGTAKKLGLYVGVPFLALVGLVGILSMLAPGFMQGSVTPDGPQTSPSQPDNTEDTQGPWENRNVKKNVELEDLLSNSIESGTIHVFQDKPTDSNGDVVWDNERAIEPYFGTQQEFDQVSVSSASTTLQYKPGTYYLAVESSGHYMKFAELEIPDGSSYESTLSEYNQAPESETLKMAETYSPTPSAIDVGVDSATTSIEEWSGDYTMTPSDGTEYRAWKMVVHTGSVDPTTDSDSDGNHDEGIRKAYFELKGANMDSTDTSVVFNPSNGVDKLGSNDKATIDMDNVVVSKDSPLTVSSYITTFETDTGTASDGDEVLTDGENPFDFQLFSDKGTGTSKTDITA